MSESSFDTSAAMTAASMTSGLSLGQCIKQSAEESQGSQWYQLQPTFEKEWHTLQGEPSSQVTLLEQISEVPLQDVSTDADESLTNESLNPVMKLLQHPSEDHKDARDQKHSNEHLSNVLEKDDSLAQRVKTLLEEELDATNSEKTKADSHSYLHVPKTSTKSNTSSRYLEKQAEIFPEREFPDVNLSSQDFNQDNQFSPLGSLYFKEPQTTSYQQQVPEMLRESLNAPATDIDNLISRLSRPSDPFGSLNTSKSTEYGDLPDAVDIPPDIIKRLNNMRMIDQGFPQAKEAWSPSAEISERGEKPNTDAPPNSRIGALVSQENAANSGTAPISGDVKYHLGSNPTTPQLPIEIENLQQLQSYMEKKTGVPSISPLVAGMELQHTGNVTGISPLVTYSTPSATLPQGLNEVGRFATATTYGITPPTLAVTRDEAGPNSAVSLYGQQTPQEADNFKRIEPEGMSPPVVSSTVTLLTPAERNLQASAGKPNSTARIGPKDEQEEAAWLANVHNTPPPPNPTEDIHIVEEEQSLADESILARIKNVLSESMSRQHLGGTSMGMPSTDHGRSEVSFASSIDSLAVQVKALLQEEAQQGNENDEDTQQANLSEVIENFEQTDLWRYVCQFLPSDGNADVSAAPAPPSAKSDSSPTLNESISDVTMNKILEKIREEFNKEKEAAKSAEPLPMPKPSQDYKPKQPVPDHSKRPMDSTLANSKWNQPVEIQSKEISNLNQRVAPTTYETRRDEYVPPKAQKEFDRTPAPLYRGEPLLERKRQQSEEFVKPAPISSGTNTTVEQETQFKQPLPVSSPLKWGAESIPGIPDFSQSVFSPRESDTVSSSTPRMQVPAFDPAMTPVVKPNTDSQPRDKDKTPSTYGRLNLAWEQDALQDQDDIRISSFRTEDSETASKHSTKRSRPAPENPPEKTKAEKEQNNFTSQDVGMSSQDLQPATSQPFSQSSAAVLWDNARSGSKSASSALTGQYVSSPSAGVPTRNVYRSLTSRNPESQKNSSLERPPSKSGNRTGEEVSSERKTSPHRRRKENLRLSGEVSRTSEGSSRIPRRVPSRSPAKTERARQTWPAPKATSPPKKSILAERVPVRDWLSSPQHKSLKSNERRLPTFDELMREEKSSAPQPIEDFRIQDEPIREISQHASKKSSQQSYLSDDPVKLSSDTDIRPDPVNTGTSNLGPSSMILERDENDSYQRLSSLNPASMRYDSSSRMRTQASDLDIQRRILNPDIPMMDDRELLPARSTPSSTLLNSLNDFHKLPEDTQKQVLQRLVTMLQQKEEKKAPAKEEDRKTRIQQDQHQRKTPKRTSFSPKRSLYETSLTSNQAVCDSDSTEYCELPSSRQASMMTQQQHRQGDDVINDSGASGFREVLGVDESRAERIMKRLLKKIDKQKREDSRKSSQKRMVMAAASSTPQKHRPPLIVPEASSIASTDTDATKVQYVKVKKHSSNRKKKVAYVEEVSSSEPIVVKIKKKPRPVIEPQRRIVLHDRSVQANFESDSPQDVATNFPSPTFSKRQPQKSKSLQTRFVDDGENKENDSLNDTITVETSAKKPANKKAVERGGDDKQRFSSFFVDLSPTKKKSSAEEIRGPVRKSLAWYEPYRYEPHWMDTQQNKPEENRGLVRLNLQEALASNLPDFVSKSRERQRRIDINAEERRLQEVWAEERQRVFGYKKTDRRSKNTTAVPTKKRVELSRRQIVAETREKYHNLPEVQRRKRDEERKKEYASNRIKAQLYKTKIQNRVLGKLFVE